MTFEPKDLEAVANRRMPFGKYRGRRISRLPEAYLIWFEDHGFPSGDLGKLMRLALMLHLEGLSNLLYPLERHDSEPRNPAET